MAVLLGNYLVKTGNSNIIDDYAIGLNLPLSFTRNTFNQTYSNLDQLAANVKMVLLTQMGERLTQPTFGSNLHKLLFQQNTGDLEEKIYTAIESAISKWIPQIAVKRIDVEATDAMKDNNEVYVHIIFTAKYNQQDFAVNFNLKA
jgi:phage baseplate assembly protein W